VLCVSLFGLGVEWNVTPLVTGRSHEVVALYTTNNRQPRPSAMTFGLLPLTRGVTFHSMPRPKRYIHSKQLDI